MRPLKCIYQDLVSLTKGIKQYFSSKNPGINDVYRESNTYYSQEDEYEYIYTNYWYNLDIKIVLNKNSLYIVCNFNSYNSISLEFHGDESNIEIEDKLNKFLSIIIKEKLLKIFIEKGEDKENESN